MKEALTYPMWRATMQAKYYSIVKNDTWELVQRLAKRKELGTKWVWKVKYKLMGPWKSSRQGLLHRATHRWKALNFKIDFPQQQG